MAEQARATASTGGGAGVHLSGRGFVFCSGKARAPEAQGARPDTTASESNGNTGEL